MDWLYYLLEANLYLVLFYGFYRLFLQNETFYNLNRYFLLLSTLLSFALPVLQLGFLKPAYEHINGELVFVGEIPPPPVEPPSAESLNNPFADLNWFYVFYLLIAFGFAIKLSFSIYKIIHLWMKAKKHNAGEITLIEVNDESTAFSFFNLLFIHPSLANQPSVLKHEMVHIKQKHSFDVVFFELIQIICWFNPIIHFIKKDIKLLHEYIADELTATADVQKHEYALFLIQNSFGLRAQPITNQIFNQSILKRRINMLNKKRTATWARLRLLLALPLTGGMLCMSTMAFTKDYGYVDLLPEKSEFVAPIQDNPKVAHSEKKEIVRPPLPLKYFIPLLITGKDKVVYSVEKRYILVNGKKVNDLKTFYGAANADKIVTLNGAQAVKKYGNVAKFGAVEITGKNIQLLKSTDGPPPPTMDVVRFPPPVVKQDKDRFRPRLEAKLSDHIIRNVDERYIVINGTPLANKSKFYGVTNTKDVIYLNKQASIKKYGEVAKAGAVEIIGDDIKYVSEDSALPPPPKVDVVRFPPPVVRVEQKYFTPNFKKDKATGTFVGLDKRYIVVNGNPVEDNSKFIGVTKTESIVYLNPAQATKVYGEKGRYGAVEIKGSEVQFNTQEDQIRFPPPIVRPDPPKLKAKRSLTPPPPPVEPRAAKKEVVRFPPPIVKPDKRKKVLNVPPPPVEPPTKKSNSNFNDENTTSLRLKKETAHEMAESEKRQKALKMRNDKIKNEIKEQILSEQAKLQKAFIKSPKSAVKEDVAVLNKVKSYLEEHLEKTKDDKTKTFIQAQLTFVQSKIAEKSIIN
ncbi:MAG: M56 family metallopeptidase [Chitinophagaceae bacterium]|nr:MAG: M56 family metallopeptidase [Chitinophagaceae bacterium]